MLASGWVTTGPEVAAFENDFAAAVGAAKAVAVSSCTAAMELSLRALRLPPGAPVLTPTLTFCGAVHAIVHAGLRPVLVDIDEAYVDARVASTVAAAGRARRQAGRDARRAPGRAPGAELSRLAAAAGLPSIGWSRTPPTPGRHEGRDPAGRGAVEARPASASTRRRTCRSARAAWSPPTMTELAGEVRRPAARHEPGRVAAVPARRQLAVRRGGRAASRPT